MTFPNASSTRNFLLLIGLAAAAAGASAQIAARPDGVMRSLWGLSASVSSGNTRATTATVNAEGVRQTDDSKWNLAGRANYSRADGGTTGANLALGTQYDRNLADATWFGFGKLDYFRDRPANIDSRVSAYGGLGRHLVRSEEDSWDLFGGLGYTEDQFVQPADVAGERRMRYGRTEGVISETSNHKLTPNTTLKQKLELYPNLRTRGEYRTVFDIGLAVAITDRMQLTTGLLHRYNSDPGLGLKRGDALFVTGISVRFE